MFDLPHPFGPTTAAIPEPESWTSVRSQKDLKPRIWTRFSLSNVHLRARLKRQRMLRCRCGLAHLRLVRCEWRIKQGTRKELWIKREQYQ